MSAMISHCKDESALVLVLSWNWKWKYSDHKLKGTITIKGAVQTIWLVSFYLRFAAFFIQLLWLAGGTCTNRSYWLVKTQIIPILKGFRVCKTKIPPVVGYQIFTCQWSFWCGVLNLVSAYTGRRLLICDITETLLWERNRKEFEFRSRGWLFHSLHRS